MDLIAFDTETWGREPQYALQPFRARSGEGWLTSYAFARGVVDVSKLPSMPAIPDEPVTAAVRQVVLSAELPKIKMAGSNTIPALFPGDERSANQVNARTKLALRAFLLDCAAKRRRIVCWNAPFDVAWLIALGLREEVFACKWLDAMMLYKHVDNWPTYHPTTISYGLKSAVERFIPECAGYDDAIDFGAVDQESMDRRLHYNKLDCRYTLYFAQMFWARMNAAMRRNAIIEAASIPLAAEAVVEGVKLNGSAAQALSDDLDKTAKVAFVTLKLKAPEVEPAILASPTKLRKLLHEDWHLPVVKMTKPSPTHPHGNASTDRDALAILAEQDPRAALLNTYREATNNRTKFAEGALRSLAYNGDGFSRPNPKVFGTYCVPGHVEVMTRLGWVRLDQWGGGDIVQVRPDRTMEFLPASRFVGPITPEWVRVSKLHCDFTPGHTVPVLMQKTYAWRTVQAGELLDMRSQVAVPVAGYLHTEGHLTPLQLRIMAMAQADGYFRIRKDGGARATLKFTFVKQRKVDRCKALLDEAGIPYRAYVCAAYPTRTEITVGAKALPAWLTSHVKALGPWVLDTTSEGLQAFMDELVRWDGSPHAGGGFKYSTAIYENARWVETIAALTGRRAAVHAKDGACWTCHISDGGAHRSLRPGQAVAVTVDQRAYCATTQTGFWLARSNGRVFITGNTGRMTYSSKVGRGKDEVPTGIPLHQWKRDPLFRDIIDPPPGYTLLEHDFAGQEFRWMAVESGDPTMQTLCAEGEDAHAFMGAKIAGVSYKAMLDAVAAGDPALKPKRQLGKVGNLSCQYRTSWMTLQLLAGRAPYFLKLTDMEARAIHATYKTTYIEVPRYWKRQVYAAKRNGYVETLAGRRIELGHDAWDEHGWSLESTAINAPIQGIGADQKYLALAVLKDYLPTVDGRFYFELHDGLFTIVPDRYADKAVRDIRKLLSNLPYRQAWGVNLPVAFPVDAKMGPSWGQLKEIKD